MGPILYTAQKMDYTDIFMTRGEKKVSLNIFKKYSIMGPTKSFDEKPVLQI